MQTSFIHGKNRHGSWRSLVFVQLSRRKVTKQRRKCRSWDYLQLVKEYSLMTLYSIKCFQILFISLHAVHSLPQFFGQSFSSSSFTGADGQIISSSVYEDTNGNRVINGAPVKSVVQAAVQPVTTVARPVAVPVAARPQSSTANKDINSGQYIPDDRGKWKGNWSTDST